MAKKSQFFNRYRESLITNTIIKAIKHELINTLSLYLKFISKIINFVKDFSSSLKKINVIFLEKKKYNRKKFFLGNIDSYFFRTV